MEGIVPEYYQLAGYVLTDNLTTPHAVANKQARFPVIVSEGKKILDYILFTTRQ